MLVIVEGLFIVKYVEMYGKGTLFRNYDSFQYIIKEVFVPDLSNNKNSMLYIYKNTKFFYIFQIQLSKPLLLP